MKKLSENTQKHIGEKITIKWGTSRGRDTYGYTTCSLYNGDGRRVAACNGGGYDLQGTVIGNWIAAMFPDELRGLQQEFYGLRFYDPHYDPLNAKLEKPDGTFTSQADVGKTFRQLQKEGKIVDLDIIRNAYAQTSKVATERHTNPSIDGACGLSEMFRILNAIGLYLEKVYSNSKTDVYRVREYKAE